MWFFILVGSVLVLFSELEKRLKAIVNIGLSCKKGAEELKEWKKQHALVCQLVTRINKSFGLILLITFSHGFVSFITSFYRFFVILQFGDTMNCLPFLMVFIQQAVFLSIFIIASYCLQSYGPELSEVVFQLEDTSDLETQNSTNSLFFFKPKNQTSYETQQPSNCQDLNNLGHTLSGFFLVNKSKPATNTVKPLLAIYCDFTRSMFTSSVNKDTEIGYLDIKTIDGGVHFYVQKSCSASDVNGIIRFNLIKLNMGNAYNKSDGIFKAPKSGVYQFAFNALKNPLIPDVLVVYLRVNGVDIGVTFSLYGLFQYPVSLHSTLQLKKGDRVYLYQGRGKFDCNDQELSSQFTGSLLEEDLIQ